MKGITSRVFSVVLAALAICWSAPAWAEGVGSDTGLFERALARGTVAALGASYVFGLLTSLTPCVYPMVAITVSVFGARKAQSRAHGVLLSLSFVAGIVCLFTPLGVASALLGRGFGSALGNSFVVSAIAVVFLMLAASLFGAFELALPSALNNRLAGVGGDGFRGAFLLGLVCGLVAAPCVGPFLFGLLGWIAATRSVGFGSAAMAAYALGLGTLFFAVGAFAVNLPKAGAWMMGIKWLGGVVLAYLALAYVRDALSSEVRQQWIGSGTIIRVLGAALLIVGLMLAAIHVAAERRRSPLARLSKPAKLASIVPAVTGLFLVASAAGGAARSFAWQSSEPAALALAHAERRPMLIDFGAAWCAACRELEQQTFPNPEVLARGERFVALHVDATDEDNTEVSRVRRKYGATEGLPVVILLASDGTEATRFTEFVEPHRFAAALEAVH